MSVTSGSSNVFIPTDSGQPYTITFTNSGNSQSQYLSGNEALNSGTTTYAESYTFVVEDLADSDYNEATVYLTWNLFQS